MWEIHKSGSVRGIEVSIYGLNIEKETEKRVHHIMSTLQNVKSKIGMLLSAFALCATAAQKPNIILIMSDDMGYTDLGCYGGEIKTPNLDQLAADGLRYTEFYNTGRCCPTRASLLTGLYPHQAGIGHMMTATDAPGYQGDLNENCLTIAQALKPAGYSTYMVGKWHVTKVLTAETEDQKYNWPLQRGFDRYYGIINGASSLWDPNSLTRDNTRITIKNDPEYKPAEKYHFTDAISDHAVRYIKESEKGKPFFMYVAYTSAHWPLHAREKDIAEYKGVYDNGYAPHREARLKRAKKLGVVQPDAELSEMEGDWDKIEDKAWEARCMEVYAAMVTQMDRGIGEIIQALKETGKLDNTLVLYFQDNGGCPEKCGRSEKGPRVERAAKPQFPPIPDDVVHYTTSRPRQTRDGWIIRRGHVMPGPDDTYIGYGRNWSNVSNTPFREHKAHIYEGGISTPLIAHWPNGINGKNAIRKNQSLHLIDLMPTCLELAGATYPAEFKGKPITPMSGKSFVATFKKDAEIKRDALYFEHSKRNAMRSGDWKIVGEKILHKKLGPSGWELYNIANDRSEMHNLAAEYPERVQQMHAKYMVWAEEAKVLPLPSGNKKK